jgi:hypothetical protein
VFQAYVGKPQEIKGVPGLMLAALNRAYVDAHKVIKEKPQKKDSEEK